MLESETLTDRETEILRLVATGVTNREIARQLCISVNTVKVHLRNVFAKLGAESRTEATMIAVREGWVHVEGAEKAAESEAPALLQALPAVPAPPLPWFKRVASVAAVLVAVAGVILTWPRNKPQAGNETSLPPPPPERAQPLGSEVRESSWRELAHMPTRRAYLALAAVGGRIFAIAGQNLEGATATVEIYDPEDDIWARGNDKPTPVTYVAAAMIGTDVYVPGGCDAGNTPTRVVEVYDSLTDSWREVSPLPEPRCAYALGVLDEKLYLFGGWNGERYVATTYVYDFQVDAWTETAPMRTGRGFAAVAPLSDRLYVVGGYDDERELTTCMAYAPQAGAWRECAPLTVGRGGLGLLALNGQIYAIGGGGWTSYLGFSERYNPGDDTWSPVETPLVGEWRGPGVVVFENTVYAVGGWSGDYLSLNYAYEVFPFRIYIPVGHQD
jgi:DNA-binding CsgD family transcriptional regulator/N-acetylneuraminic acid mutarotase